MRSTLKYDIIIQNYGGHFFMKTKIIYISGSEVFEMSDVRAAFDEVRNALGLGRDTVLFGVPVDCDDALSEKPQNKSELVTNTPVISETDETLVATSTTTEILPEIPDEIIDNVISVDTETTTPIQEETPAPIKKSRGRPRKVNTMDSVPSQSSPNIEEVPENINTENKVIPILSVLASKMAQSETPDEPADTASTDNHFEESVTEQIKDQIDEPTDIITQISPESPDNEYTDQTSVSIDDMIADDAPEIPVEKTLEQLLESMKPLREDHGENGTVNVSDNDVAPMDITDTEITPTGDTDATLEQLAAEFANSEDKITAPIPTTTQGKIGKLKNILPFKKARREDTGIMGDLFGWAGVAANDEDFTIPGFFTNAASKK